MIKVPKTQVDNFDSKAFGDGFSDGQREICPDQPYPESHEAMGDAYCTGFDAGVFAANAWREGSKAARTLAVSCYRLADIDGPWFAQEWIDGMWAAFSDEDCEKGFSA